MGHTLAELRRELARSLDSYVSGVATGGTEKTLIDDLYLKSGQFRQDFFIGGDLYIIKTSDGHAPQGEARYVIGFEQVSGTVTLGMPFSAPVEMGDRYELYKNASVDELNQALMFAVQDWNFTSSDALITTNAEYEIVCGGLVTADQISGVWVRDGDNAADGYQPLSNYRLWMKAGTINLEIKNQAILGGRYYLRVEYQARYDQLKDNQGAFLDSAVVGGDLAKMILDAKRFYYDRRMNSATGVDRDWYAQLLTFTIEQQEKVKTPPRRATKRAQQQNYGGV